MNNKNLPNQHDYNIMRIPLYLTQICKAQNDYQIHLCHYLVISYLRLTRSGQIKLPYT